MDQFEAPLADALRENAAAGYISFDVPGHKQVSRVLADYFGERALALDINSRAATDYLCQPSGVIRKAEALAAEAFSAAHAMFMVGGTTSSVQAMIMSVCAPGEKIILPRNVHSSVINAVIVSGASPVYIDPTVHPRLGISLGMRVAEMERVILENRDAKAVFLNNPTYYGVCSHIRAIVALAHRYGMRVLVDEAHGTHFYFHEDLPEAAMACGADMAAVSMHKTGGSLTQSSLLLMADTVDYRHVQNIVNLTRTTSASYLLLASLDLARRYLATEGHAALTRTIALAERTRARINAIGGYLAFGRDIVDGDAVYDFDVTKLSVNTLGTGLVGIEVYSLLRDEYRVQPEFGDMGNILAMATLSDTEEAHEALVCALAQVAAAHASHTAAPFRYEYIPPKVIVSPRAAFYSRKRALPVAECVNQISGDSVMCYPPGVPLLAPGELITEQIVEHILLAAEKGCSVTGLSERGELSVLDGI